MAALPILLVLFCILLPSCDGHKKSIPQQYLKEDLLRIGKTNQDILAAEARGEGGWSALLDCCKPIDWVQERAKGLPSSVCEKIVTYPTIQYCGLHQAIDNANADFAASSAIIDNMNTNVYKEARNTSLCVSALLKGICAYHFWLCTEAIPDRIYNDVCHETCTFVEQECGVPLSGFTGLSKSSALHLGCKFEKSNQFMQDCTSNSVMLTAWDSIIVAALAVLLLISI